MRRLPNERAALTRAKARLDRLGLYPRPVRTDGVRALVVPWLFRLPALRRYDGYALPNTILLRHAGLGEDLLAHELCHVWQMQHGRLRVFRAWLRFPYEQNPFELEARRAVAETRS
jgi:hypothetical protein